MKTDFDLAVRKRPVTLFGVVESFLTDFVSRAQREKLQKAKVVEAAMASWNQFNSSSVSIADEYSSL